MGGLTTAGVRVAISGLTMSHPPSIRVLTSSSNSGIFLGGKAADPCALVAANAKAAKLYHTRRQLTPTVQAGSIKSIARLRASSRGAST